jgi:hypothetical protein
MNKFKSMLEALLREHADFSELLDSMRAMPHIVLRGAGRYGRDTLKLLLHVGIPRGKFCFWDQRADVLSEQEDIPVLPPFTGGFNPEETLIVHCIGAIPDDAQNYEAHGYSYYVSGADLYTILACRQLIGAGPDTTICEKNIQCAFIRCPKIYPYDKTEAPSEALISENLTFVVTHKCTLQCAHCSAYLNHFPPEDKINFSMERIKKDIDRISEVFDFIRVVSVHGGETFLHPDLPEIIRHMLAKPNFGVIMPLTNCICDFSDECLSVIANERCLIRVSYYPGLNAKQSALVEKNIMRLKERGVRFRLKKYSSWFLPPTLKARGLSQECLEEIKSTCIGRQSMTVTNGRYYPCCWAQDIDKLGAGNYADDKVMIDDHASPETLRTAIIACNQKPFYQSCDHCDSDVGDLCIPPAEQGIDPRYLHLGPIR